jgi:hypothetical protein
MGSWRSAAEGGQNGAETAEIGREGGSIGTDMICQETRERIYPPPRRPRRRGMGRRDATHQK